jgi:hypothetical protein
MSNADDVARVREIKRLLDRIQRMPLEPREPGSPNGGWGDEAERSAGDRTVSPGSSLSPWLFVMATALNTIVAAVLAVVITLGVVRREPAGEAEQAALAGKLASEPRPVATGALFARTKDAAEARAIELLPVGSPAEPLRLEAMKPARLPFQIRPEEAMQETYILVLSGLPANAALSGATRMGSDSWLLPPGSLAQLEIVLTEWSASAIEIGVELRRTSGLVAAHSKAWLSVPPPVQQGAKPDQATIRELLSSGDRLLNRGDVAAARALYERAAAMGSPAAALALGSTYDPTRLWSLGVFGMVGNKERARHWYQRAEKLGHPEAKDRLKAVVE